jgi:hypothetical protein
MVQVAGRVGAAIGDDPHAVDAFGRAVPGRQVQHEFHQFVRCDRAPVQQLHPAGAAAESERLGQSLGLIPVVHHHRIRDRRPVLLHSVHGGHLPAEDGPAPRACALGGSYHTFRPGVNPRGHRGRISTLQGVFLILILILIVIVIRIGRFRSAGTGIRLIQPLPGNQHVQTRGTLPCRITGPIEKSAAVRRRVRNRIAMMGIRKQRSKDRLRFGLRLGLRFGSGLAIFCALRGSDMYPITACGRGR